MVSRCYRFIPRSRVYSFTVQDDTRRRFHHLRLPQISCSEGTAVQVASVFLGGVGGSGGGWGVVISFS